MGERRGAYRVLVERPEGKNHLVRPRHRWKDNIKNVCSEVGWGGMRWFDLIPDMASSWRL